MKIKSIKLVGEEPTWDISTTSEQYLLSNGVLSHNTSSKISNMTNGVEPIRALINTKGGSTFVVPGYDKYKNNYVSEWDIDLAGYIQVLAIIQKFMDQAISLQTRYDPTQYPESTIPAATILNHINMCLKYGLKTMYYQNNRQVNDENQVYDEMQNTDSVGCDSGGCAI